MKAIQLTHMTPNAAATWFASSASSGALFVCVVRGTKIDPGDPVVLRRET